VFPKLVGNGLYGHVAHGYWKDIGTPDRYLEGTFDILEGTVSTEVQQRLDSFLHVAEDVENAGRIAPAALVEQGVRIGQDAHIGGRVVLERGATVGARSRVEQSVVMQGTEIGADCVVRDAIIAGGVRIGDRCHIEGHAVIGEGVTIGADNVITNGARIFPHVTLPDGAIKF
jgi:mannose-1-phosphate guanylyltransferase